MQRKSGCLGCLTKLVLWGAAAAVFAWGVVVALNPWALRIGGRATPLLYWHGTGTVQAANGIKLPLYVTFWPGEPQGIHGGMRREGKRVSANLSGTGWLCVAPGQVERMDLSGTMYGGYTDSANSLFAFRLLEWQKPVQVNYKYRGFFDVAGMWHGQELVMDRKNQQGIKFKSGLFVDHATVTLHWASYGEFEAACGAMGSTTGQ
ncbi:MAG TPA: hypothetical protein VMV57_09455 [Terracidiphilus sp.]|nr:hypothetical protein [Terracidiphilus sp.]